MTTLPTDLEILRRIYSMYLDEFIAHSREKPIRAAKIYVPIDITKVAADLRTDPDLLFGRLYYHLDHKYRYRQADESIVPLFSLSVGSDPHCVNFPYLAAIVSERNVEHRRNLWAIWLSVGALILSAGSIIAQLVTARGGREPEQPSALCNAARLSAGEAVGPCPVADSGVGATN